MTDFKVGDIVKSTENDHVFRITDIAGDDLEFIPAGWIVDNVGRYCNPQFYRLYNGATSVLAAALGEDPEFDDDLESRY